MNNEETLRVTQRMIQIRSLMTRIPLVTRIDRHDNRTTFKSSHGSISLILGFKVGFKTLFLKRNNIAGCIVVLINYLYDSTC